MNDWHGGWNDCDIRPDWVYWVGESERTPHGVTVLFVKAKVDELSERYSWHDVGRRVWEARLA